MKDGLQSQAKQAREQAEWNLKKSRNVRRDPRTAHDHEQSAKHHLQRAEKLENAAEMNAQVSELIGQLVNTLASSAYNSSEREHAAKHLYEARFWLRHELEGDQS